MLRPKCMRYFLLIYSSMDLVNLILNSCLVPPLWNRRAALHCTIHAILEQCVALYIVWSVYLPNCFREINTISSYLFLLCWTSLLLPQTIFSRLILPSQRSFGFSSSSLPTVAAGGSLFYSIWRAYPTYLPVCLSVCLPACLLAYSILVLKASAAQSFLFFKFIAGNETGQSQFLCVYKTTQIHKT